MFKRSTTSGLVLTVAALLALSTTACSSGSTAKVATSSSAPVSTSGPTTPSASAQTGSASGSSASASSASTPSSSDFASPSSSFTPPAITNKTSDWVERSGFRLKVDTVTYPYLPPASSHYQPMPNEEYLKLHIELVNVAGNGNGNGTFSMMDLDVRDGGNVHFVPDVVVTDDLPKDVRLDLLNLKPGEKQTGEVVFDGPKNATKGLRLVFTGTVMTRDGKGFTDGPPPVIDLGV